MLYPLSYSRTTFLVDVNLSHPKLTILVLAAPGIALTHTIAGASQAPLAVYRSAFLRSPAAETRSKGTSQNNAR
jgi:hypothetical protein